MQFDRASWAVPSIDPKNKPEFTGAIFCPQRVAGIAVMRCAEYQCERGCGRHCPNAAGRELIELVTVNSKQDLDAQPEVAICIDCGHKKKSNLGARCQSCAGHAVRVKAGKARAAQIRKAQGRCMVCRAVATYLDKTVCGNCYARLKQQGEI